MKKPKGKKSGIKGQNKKSLARFKTEWKIEKGKPKAYIVRKPEPPDTPLKESAKAMNFAFNNPLGSVETPVTKVDERVRAEVINISSAPKLRLASEPDKPTREEIKNQIAGLEAHINATKGNEECGFVGPPKPPELSIISQHVPDEVIGKTSSSAVEIPHNKVAANDLHKYGKIIKDVGDGMTPSGLPISSFEDGTWKPVTWVRQPEPELHTVTSEDYTYEELAELYDLALLDIHDLKVRQKAHVDMLNDHINELGRGYHDVKTRLSVAELGAVSSDSEDGIRRRLVLAKNTLKETEDALFAARQEIRQLSKDPDVAIVELQTENAYLDKENSELRQEIEDLMDTVDKQQRHVSKSVISKPPLKTLASNFCLYKKLHEDNPLTNFLRYSGQGDLDQEPLLRAYFDHQMEVREHVNDERKMFARWASRYVPHVRKKYSERLALRRIRNNNRKLHTVTDVLQQRWDKVLSARRHDEWVKAEGQVFKDWGSRSTTSSSHLNNRLSRQEVRLWWRSNITEDQVIKREYEAHHNDKLRVLEEAKKSVLYKPAKAIVKSVRAIGKALDYELSPSKRAVERKEEETRQAKAEHKKSLIKASKKAKRVEASRIKRMAEEQIEADERADARDRILKRGAYFNT